MSEIVGVVSEMKTIIGELKRLRSETQRLNKRKKDLEGKIVDYLQKKDEQGFKYNGMAVITEEKDRRPYKKKSEKMETGMSILEEYGIQNSKEVLEELLEKMKGSPVQETKIKIKDLKKK